MNLTRYGIDAPSLVRGFALAGAAFLLVGLALLHFFSIHPWAFWPTALLLLLSAYGFFMCGYMLWSSLVTKVRGRDRLLDLIPWDGSEQVLDVGCGRGLLLVGAARRLTSGHATGVDLWIQSDQASNNQAATLRNATAEQVADRITVQTADMRQLPFPDCSFNVVVSHWVVHNLGVQADRTKALAEMVRVLRPGGTLLLADITEHPEYQAALNRLGFADIRLITPPATRDTFNRLVSFGSFGPATHLARKP